MDSDQERLRRFGPSGAEIPGAAIPVHGEPLTPEAIAEAKRSEAGNGDDPRLGKWLEARYDPAVLPQRLPFGGLLVDSDSLIWLAAYRGDRAPGHYFVLSREAHLLSVVTVPAGFRATDVGSDYCLGIETDDDGVESIVMYRLTRR